MPQSLDSSSSSKTVFSPLLHQYNNNGWSCPKTRVPPGLPPGLVTHCWYQGVSAMSGHYELWNNLVCLSCGLQSDKRLSDILQGAIHG